MRIKCETRNEIVIKKSRFIACGCPVKREDDAKSFIRSLHKEFHDATHICSAYILNENQSVQHSNDNGEPPGTAGMPILETIKKHQLSDTCVCVVRYFGGIKLGTNGLIRAYSESASALLMQAKKVKDISVEIYSVTYPYTLSGTIEPFIRRNGNLIQSDYQEKVTTTFSLSLQNPVQAIVDLTRGQCVPVYLKTIITTVDAA